MASLPNGEATATYVEETRTILTLVHTDDGKRLFLQTPTKDLVAIELPPDLEWQELVGVRASPLVLARLTGPSRPRSTEPLILDTGYLWLIDTSAQGARPLPASSEFSVMRLLAAADRADHVLCICSDSRRTSDFVIVDYHVGLVSALSGEVTVLERAIGTRW